MQDVDDRTKDIVSGYIREQHKVFLNDKHLLFRNIPDCILILCILNYRLTDYFEIIGDGTISSDDGKSITKLESGWHNTSYGTEIDSTDQCVYKWWLKVPSTQRIMLIGIASSADFRTDQAFDDIRNSKYYGIYVFHETKTSHELITTDINVDSSFDDTEIFCMELDLIQKKLIIHYGNDLDKKCIAFEHIDVGNELQSINYRLAISIGHTAQVSMLKFQQ